MEFQPECKGAQGTFPWLPMWAMQQDSVVNCSGGTMGPKHCAVFNYQTFSFCQESHSAFLCWWVSLESYSFSWAFWFSFSESVCSTRATLYFLSRGGREEAKCLAKWRAHCSILPSPILQCLGLTPGSAPIPAGTRWEAAGDVQVLASLLATRETQSEFLTPGFGMVQPQLLQAFREQATNGGSRFVSSFLSNKKKITKNIKAEKGYLFPHTILFKHLKNYLQSM